MSLFVNPAVLEQTFLPKLLKFREEQHKYLAECIKPIFEGRSGSNLLISGPSGIGKTACTKYILRELLENTDNIMPIYINCWKRDTSTKIISEIARKMDIRLTEKIFSDELFDRIIERLGKYDGVVFAFDELDKAKDYDFLYRILEDVPYKTVFLITNIKDIVTKMDSRLLSRMLLEKVEFRPYNFEETRQILFERQNYAFAPNSWDYDASEMVMRKAYDARDIRTGLVLMKTAGELANNENAPKVLVRHVEKAMEKFENLGKSKLDDFV
ncbi:MAG: AAA family ATPase [Candidatus Aenigmarchaeota archaeon]|nr:AAA family ATPase [Candidatus Aenigmarchaeota archaeon]